MARSPKTKTDAIRTADKLFDQFGDKVISVRGAREHNLKNVDLTIPRDKLVVFTGLSGSGKSSRPKGAAYKPLSIEPVAMIRP